MEVVPENNTKFTKKELPKLVVRKANPSINDVFALFAFVKYIFSLLAYSGAIDEMPEKCMSICEEVHIKFKSLSCCKATFLLLQCPHQIFQCA